MSRACELTHSRRETRVPQPVAPSARRASSRSRPADARRRPAVHPAAITLTDATVAVGEYLKHVRSRRADGAVQSIPSAVEAAFVRAAATFGTAHGIDHESWRSVGVPADVLRRAGIGRRHRRS